MNARMLLSTLVASIAGALVMAGCAANVDDEASDEEMSEADLTSSGPIGGYDLAGPKRAAPRPRNTFCPEVVDAVQEACMKKGGRTTAVAGCKSVCSVPIAAAGKIAGFDMGGFKTRAALPEGTGCPEIADAVTDACITAKGKTSMAQGCKVLCSVPVAPSGKVAGYDLKGYKKLDAMPTGTMCPEMLDEASEACRIAKGRVTQAKGCKYLCSLPIGN